MLWVYTEEGENVGAFNFVGHPIPGDCFVLDGRLWYIVSRRWTTEGVLELIVSEDAP